MRLSAHLLSKLELTLAVIKPDVVCQPLKYTELKDAVISGGFLFVRSKKLRWSREDAQQFYKEHEGRFFYNRLVSYMSSGAMSAHILAKENAIMDWRRLMGPTKVFRAKHLEPTSLRGRFGLTDTRNATHGSDSPESVAKEMSIFFPEFCTKSWFSEEEPFFRGREVYYCKERGVHLINGGGTHSEDPEEELDQYLLDFFESCRIDETEEHTQVAR